MSKVEWGPEIAVNGKKPDWLDNNEGITYSINDAPIAARHWPWVAMTEFRLPADHWYYKQQPIELNDYNDYQALRDVLDEAYEQAANGKGKDRHADGKAWLNQPIFEIGRMVGVGFNTGQAIKKLQESSRMEPDAAIRELLGAIVYAASAIQLIREGGE